MTSLLAAAVLIGASGRGRCDRRVSRLRPVKATARTRGSAKRTALVRSSWALPTIGAGSVLIVGVLLFGVIGLVVAGLAAPGAVVLLRKSQRARSPARNLAEIPLILDLLAAALRTGAPVPLAVLCVSDSAAGQTGRELRRVGVLLSLGAGPAEAWSALSGTELDVVRAVAVRSGDSGARLSEACSRQARVVREDLRTRGVAAAQRVGVFALLPLGLCFLPAFVCLGIIPVIAGIAHDVVGGAR